LQQKVFENKKVPYAWNFNNLNISYFEIPKTGSSSTKTLLFQKNFALREKDSLDIAKGRLKHQYAEAVLRNFKSDGMQNRVLIVYRNPISRAKSVYRHVFLGMHRLKGSMSDYLANYLEDFLHMDPIDSLYNHHKPMTWFFPNYLIEDSRSIFIETEELKKLPDLLGFEANKKQEQVHMPHLLKMDKNKGDIDLNDDEIRVALGPYFNKDFELFDKLGEERQNR